MQRENYFTAFEPLETSQPYSLIPYFSILVEDILRKKERSQKSRRAS
jgi:hypothetical protein